MMTIAAVVEEFYLFLDAQVAGMRVALQLLRFARTLRMIRLLNSFIQLRVVVNAVLSSARPVFWCITVQLLLMFFTGTAMMTLIVSVQEETPHDLQNYAYGTLPGMFYVMHMAVLGGIDWEDTAATLFHLQAGSAVIFVIYVTFVLLCVLNIFTGIFVKKATKTMQQDFSRKQVEQTIMRQRWFRSIMHVFQGDGDTPTPHSHRCSGEDNATVTLDSFGECYANPTMQSYLQTVGIQVACKEGANALFHILDFDKTGTVSLAEFLHGLEMVGGSARQLDLYETSRVVQKVHSDVRRLIDEVSGLKTAMTSHGFKVQVNTQGIAALRPPPSGALFNKGAVSDIQRPRSPNVDEEDNDSCASASALPGALCTSDETAPAANVLE
eukprot:NODE_2122_length_2288_cov_15.015733.p1 GENE.NODE_2122_length_2288_cov_15.015733~~NODE_2122_length_2288_cov_15.015733.p1  ORF type:complete len:382 (+),score=77.50 NODE_2122_length_2288_cov_15.015733:950-2095(+)